jgi:hypothetical protein
MKNEKLILLVVAIASSITGIAQNEVDALRYSRLGFGGTARYNSMAGAFGARGGDLSVASTNPAGIGVFRRTELSFTPAVSGISTNSLYYGNSAESSKLNMNVGSVGLAINFLSPSSHWTSSTLAIGYNRLASFHNSQMLEGKNNKSSMLDVFKNQLNQNNWDPFGSQLAWETYLIDVDSSSGKYNYYHAIPNYGQKQSNSIYTTGAAGETYVSYAGNYDDRLYMGGTIGFTSIRYTRQSEYSEFTNANDTTTTLKDFTFSENLSTTGNGYNFKFGLLYRINDFVRIGGAIHTPTIYSMSDSWNSSMVSHFDSVSYSSESPKGNFNYSLSAPFRAIGSLAFVIGKAGIISADYELTDYSSSKLYSKPRNAYSFSSENIAIQNNYGMASNIRLGAEARYDIFSFRAGYALYGNPYNSKAINSWNSNAYTFGFGFKEEGYYLDLAYVLNQSSEKYFPYEASLVQGADMKTTSHSLLITLGFRY